VCCDGRLAEKGGRPTGVNQLQARASRSAEHPAPPALATVTRTPTQTNQTLNHAHRAQERAGQRLLGVGDTVPGCTVRPAATTGGVPANCAVQAALPYAPSPSFHINPTVQETAELHEQFGSGVWLKQAQLGSDMWLKQAQFASGRWLNQATVQNTCLCQCAYLCLGASVATSVFD